MKTEVNNIETTRRELSIHLPWDEISGDYSKFLKKFAKKIELPGFRKGKVPASRVEKLYAKNIEYDFINEKFYGYYYDAVKESESQPVSEPQISKLEFDKGEGLHLAVEFDVIPDWEMPEINKKIKVEKTIFKLNDADLDSTLQKLREQHAEVLPVDESVNGSQLQVATYDLIDGEEGILKDSEKEETLVIGEEPYEGEIGESLIGAKAGDTVQVTLSGQGPDGKNLIRVFDINKVEEKKLPELNDEFAQVVDGTYESLDDLKKAIYKEMEDYWSRESDKKLQNDIMTELLNAAESIEIPDSLVNSYIDDLRENREKKNQQSIDPEEFRKAGFDDARNAIKWQLIRERIIKDNDIKAEDDDVDVLIEKNIASFPEENRELYRQFYKSDQMRKELVHQVEDEKMFEFISSNITVKDKKQKLEDLKKEGKA